MVYMFAAQEQSSVERLMTSEIFFTISEVCSLSQPPESKLRAIEFAQNGSKSRCFKQFSEVTKFPTPLHGQGKENSHNPK